MVTMKKLSQAQILTFVILLLVCYHMVANNNYLVQHYIVVSDSYVVVSSNQQQAPEVVLSTAVVVAENESMKSERNVSASSIKTLSSSNSSSSNPNMNATTSTTALSSSSSSSLLQLAAGNPSLSSFSGKKRNNHTPIAFLFEGGCTGSSAINRHINRTLVAHGLERFDVGNRFEFLDTWSKNGTKNPIYKRLQEQAEAQGRKFNPTESLLESIQIAKQQAQASGTYFYFKVPFKMFHLVPRIRDLGIEFMTVVRENVLDRCICNIRDCFPQGVGGYPVDATNGNRSNLCFQRRFYPNVTTMAYLENPKQCVMELVQTQEDLVQQSLDIPLMSTEQLFGVEYTAAEEALEKSKWAWMTILRPLLGDELNETIVTEVLEAIRASLPPLPPHREAIYNYEFVKKKFEGTRWARFIREG